MELLSVSTRYFRGIAFLHVAMRKILPTWQASGIVKHLVAGSRSLFKVSIYDIDELFCGFCLL
jgi:hypothetical protein